MPRSLVFLVLAITMLARSSSSVAAVIFSASVPTLPYVFDSEGGTLSNNVEGASTVGPQPLGSGSTNLVLEFLAPAGQQFRYDSTAYNGGAGFSAFLEFIPLIYGANPTGIDGQFLSAELINPSGSVSIGDTQSQDLEEMPVNDTPKTAFRFATNAALSGVGTFTGFRFTYSLTGLTNQSMSFGSQYVDIVNPTPPIMLVNQSGLPRDQGAVLTFTAVPEPSSYAVALAGLTCGGYSLWRRRKRA